MEITIAVTETMLNTAVLADLFIEGEAYANKIIFEMPKNSVGVDFAALTYVLAGTTQKDTRTEATLVKSTVAGKTILTWEVNGSWTAVPGAMAMELMGQDSTGRVVKKWLASHALLIKPTLGPGALPQPDIIQQYLAEVRTGALQVSQNATTVTAAREAVATDAANVAANAAAAAGSATSAAEKATSATASAATAKAEADRATAIVGFDGSYGVLTGKPKINNVELLGNKTLAELGAAAQTEVTANTQARHTHGNKGVLDGITAALITGWNGAVDHITDAVKHITAAERTLWNTITSKADAAKVSEELSQKVNGLNADKTIYVAKTGSDTTGDGTTEKPFLTIKHAINILPSVLNYRTRIYIRAGTYDENIVLVSKVALDGFFIEGVNGDVVSIKTLLLKNINGQFMLNNLKVVGNSGDGYNWSIHIDLCSGVLLENITCTEPVATQHHGTIRIDNSSAFISNTTISNKQIAVDVLASTVYLNNTDTGANNATAIRCGSGNGSFGGYTQKGGATIAGAEEKSYGGQIW